MAYYDALIAAWNGATQPPAGVTGTALVGTMTTAQKLSAVNGWTVAGPGRSPLLLRGSDIYNAIVPAEFTALAAAQQQNVRDVFGLGDVVDCSTGTNARAVLLGAFAAGSTTRANLAALANTTMPWWQSSGYTSPINSNDLVMAGGLA